MLAYYSDAICLFFIFIYLPLNVNFFVVVVHVDHMPPFGLIGLFLNNDSEKSGFTE